MCGYLMLFGFQSWLKSAIEDILSVVPKMYFILFFITGGFHIDLVVVCFPYTLNTALESKYLWFEIHE